MTAHVQYFDKHQATVTNLVWTGVDAIESEWLNYIWIAYLEEQLSAAKPDQDMAAAEIMAKFLEGTAKLITPAPLEVFDTDVDVVY